METARIVMTSTFYPPYHLGGDAIHVRYLAEELARRGHEVHVLHSLDAYSLKVKGPLPEPESSAVHTHPVGGGFPTIATSLTYLNGRNPAAERVMAQLMAEVRPDWVHHHNISLLGAGLLSIGTAPRMFTSHDHWLACPCSDLAYRGREVCEGGSCTLCSLLRGRPPQWWRGADFQHRLEGLSAVISPSRYMSRFLEERLSLGSEVLPNFVPRPGMVGEKERHHFVFSGVLEPHKGLDTLLQGYELSGVRSELHVLGRGSLEGAVAEAGRRTEGRIKGLGFLPRQEVLKEVAGAIAVIAPSVCPENSPLACIEALSLGTPLIVSPYGGLPELAMDGGGVVAEPTPQALGKAMAALEQQDDALPTMRARALDRYERHHTPERYIDHYLELSGGAA